MSGVKTIFTAVVGVGAFVGGIMWLFSESDEDIARKPELIEQITQNSITYCANQSASTDEQSTIDRLRAVLERTRSTSLDFLLENNVTVCLDKRIANESYGFWDKKPEAIYYPESKVVALWDDGTETTFWNKGAARYGDDMLDELATSIGNGFFDDFKKIDDIEVPYIGYTYIVSTGKSTTRHYNFDTVNSSRFSDLLPKHPTLKHSPMRNDL